MTLPGWTDVLSDKGNLEENATRTRSLEAEFPGLGLGVPSISEGLTFTVPVLPAVAVATKSNFK